MTDLTFEDLFNPIAEAAVSAFEGLKEGIWDTIQNVVLNQLKQLGIAVLDIVEGLTANEPYYTQESAKILIEMSITSVKSTIAAATELLITEVNIAINTVLEAIRDTVESAIDAVLF